MHDTPDWNTQGAQIAYDAAGTEYYRYSFVDFVATFDINHGYTALGNSGHTALMDGFSPPTNFGSITLQVGQNHWSHTIYGTMNGMWGEQLEHVKVNGYSKNPLSCWKPLTNGWRFLPNKQTMSIKYLLKSNEL